MSKKDKNGWSFGLTKENAFSVARCNGSNQKKTKTRKVWKGLDGTYAASPIAGSNPH